MDLPASIELCCTIDQAYVTYAATMLYSARRATVQPLHVYLVYADMPRALVRALERFLSKIDVTFMWIRIDEHKLQGAKLSHHVSLATYYRLLLGSTIPRECERLLFLDADLLIVSDLSELWNWNVQDGIFGAVPDESMDGTHREQLLGNASAPYFNAGVLLLNLKKWRDDSFEDECLRLMRDRADDVVFWDQDVLNRCGAGRWQPLPLRWNAITPVFDPDFDKWPGDYAHCVEEARQDPAIIHFCGGGDCKPWREDCRNEMAPLYRQIADEARFTLPPPPLPVRLARLYRRVTGGARRRLARLTSSPPAGKSK